jgi:energy-converting hydrogenase Eha subunit F
MFELLAELFSRSLNKFKSAKDGKEKRVQLINIIFWTVCAFISLILYIPRGLSTVEVLISIVVFVFTIYSVIRALKYFKIL